MTAARVLNQSQAEAVYSAMCALNNVGTICGDLTLNEGLRVQWLERVTVRDGLSGPREEYPNQAAFAAAYGLNADTAPAVCGECGGRGVVDTGVGLASCTCSD